MKRLFGISFIVLLLHTSSIWAQNKTEDYTRSFWYPSYHGERLAYCNLRETECGGFIANAYCKILGYAKARQYRIQHHVGRAHYFANEGECTGWKCDGFLFIDCEGAFKEKPHPIYQYRKKVFVYPRFSNDRVDWCYQENRLCGQRAAYSFCRRKGYTKVISFEQDEKVEATKTLGDKVLCYGKTCKGFKRITCMR